MADAQADIEIAEAEGDEEAANDARRKRGRAGVFTFLGVTSILSAGRGVSKLLRPSGPVGAGLGGGKAGGGKGGGGKGGARPKGGAPAVAVEEFVAQLPRKTTPTGSAANQFAVKHTGPYNYTVSGGGTKFDIDGYRGRVTLDAKDVGNPSRSPFVPGSEILAFLREKIVAQQLGELRRIKNIIDDADNPFSTLEIITNSTPRRCRYIGQEHDDESGLDLMGTRYYAPWLGRWTAADPIGLGDGINKLHSARRCADPCRRWRGAVARQRVLKHE